jgi:hypothetical protein
MARGKGSKNDDGGLLRTAESLGINRGLLGGNKAWAYVGTGLWTLRRVRKMAERKSEILISENLAPGERIVIANGRATIEQTEQRGKTVRSTQEGQSFSRKERKAEKKRAEQAAADAKVATKAEKKAGRKRAKKAARAA